MNNTKDCSRAARGSCELDKEGTTVGHPAPQKAWFLAEECTLVQAPRFGHASPADSEATQRVVK